MKPSFKLRGSNSLRLSILIAMGVTALPTSVFAAAEEAVELEEVVTIGTRSNKERSASDSPVAIDVIGGDDFTAIGSTADLTDNLRAMVPSFSATPATGDGSAFVRPTSLRGMAPDQTLILVNGKRRHRAALVQFFAPSSGNGSHGADIGLIPGAALKRVEVLRDGAAAQYGSDAIAGVINLVTKDNAEGVEITGQFGEHFEDEESSKASINVGMPLMDTGFLNLTLEAFDNEALSRGFQRPDAQGLINGGVIGVGADSPFGDGLAQTWGRPESSGYRAFYNASVEISDDMNMYVFGNYAETDGRYRFFYRNPFHSSILALRNLGYKGLVAGYTPYLDGEQSDFSIVGGVDGEFGNGTTYDVSFAYGENELDYTLNNTLNATLGLVNGEPAQRVFDTGAYKQEEVTLNADFSSELRDNINLGYGVEWREETYIAKAGELNSYTGAGSNGLRGITPQDAGEFDRDNFAIYADAEHDISDEWLMQYAIRFEDYSDFGGTTNYKIATRYRVNDALALRAAISTGFHAPTPGQSNVKTTLTTFDGATGLQIEEGLVRPTSADALSVGGSALKEEESFNLSAGATLQMFDNTTLTVDVYKIEVEDKIYRTSDIQLANGKTISFYTNVLDIESTGLDVVLTTGFDWGQSAVSTDLSWAFSYNEIEVTGQDLIAGQQVVSDRLVGYIENNAPNERWVMTANTMLGEKWNWMVRINYYGDHFDERGTIGSITDPTAEIDPSSFIDTELSYAFSENLTLTLGSVNVFDNYVDEVGPPNGNRQSVGLQYPRRSAANYEGGSWYLRGKLNF